VMRSPIVMRRKAEQAMALARHKAGGVPGTTVVALDTVTINRVTSPASQPISDGTIGPLFADRSLALRAPSRTGACTRRGSAQIGSGRLKAKIRGDLARPPQSNCK
jgi:hypothetical protein